MREPLPFLVGAAVILAAVMLAGAQKPDTDAAPILASAREALGGDQKLTAIRSFTASGRTRQVRGNNLASIEFEISCELPDKYVRRDEVPAQESGATSTGFNGDDPIQLPPPPQPPPQAAGVPAQKAAAPAPPGPAPAAVSPPPDPRAARVASIKQDFVKLTLGLFAASFRSYPLTFARAGQAEAPQGKADILDVKGPGTFALKLFVNADTHLPIMVSWTVPATNVVVTLPGQPAPENLPPGSVIVRAPPPPAPDAPKEEQDKYAKDVQDLRRKALTTAKTVEHRIYYADYREVSGGIRFPFRLRRSIAGETVEETTFDGYRINPRIDPRKFATAR